MKNIAILIYPNVEVLDFAGPYEVFTTGSRVAVKRGFDISFNVFTVAMSKEPIQARAGLQVLPDFAFYEHPAIDVLIIPGGVVDTEIQNEFLLEWIKKVDIATEVTASICTGVFLLAKADVLKTNRVTTHWEDIEDLRTMFMNLEVMHDVRWVDEGKNITSAGISAGIDMSLHLIERLCSRELAEATAKQLDFDWCENVSVV